MVERFRVDVAAAVRALRASPATAAAAVLTLAIAIGINLAMFGLVDRALLSPPARVNNPERVFTVGFEFGADDGRRSVAATTSYVTYESIRDGVRAASAVAAWHYRRTSAIVLDEHVPVEAMFVTGSYFSMLDVRPHLGRGIEPTDERPPAGEAVVVLSHAFWIRAFSGDPNVLNRRVRIGGADVVVIGVMPAGFSGHSAARRDLWLPLYFGMREMPGWDRNRFLSAVEVGVRVLQHHARATASAQASAITGHRVVLSPIVGMEVAPDEYTTAYWLAGVSMLLLAMGLANTATLLLLRSVRRRREWNIRALLGATRGRLLLQTVIEAGILAAVATCAALSLAYWFDEAVRRLFLPSLVESTGLSVRIVGAGLLAGVGALVVGSVVGVTQVPALVHGKYEGARRGALQTELLRAQVTLAVILVAGAGMFARSSYNLGAQDFGIRMDDVLLVHFEPGANVRNTNQIFLPALERIRALPGVELVSPIQSVPFWGIQVPEISVPGVPKVPTVNGHLPFHMPAATELFDILRLQVVEGRRFVPADETGAPVAIVNQTMARTIWPGESAIGRCFQIGFRVASGPCREIVGVVRDVRQMAVVPRGSETQMMQYFVPFSQALVLPGETDSTIGTLMLRTTIDASTLAKPIRELVLNGRTNLPFLHVRPYAELLEPQLRPWRMATGLLTMFGALALIVAAVGLYAAFEQSVVARRREMAIRIAIGARPGRVVAMILREATSLAAVGIVSGCGVAILAGRWVESMLFGTTTTDPLVLGSAGAVTLIVAVVATCLPAINAARADPGALLRAE